MRLKRAILIISLTLLVLTAGLGLLAVITDRYGYLMGDLGGVLGISAVLSVPALAASYLREKGAWRPAMLVSILFCIGAVAATVGLFVLYSRYNAYRWQYGYAGFGWFEWMMVVLTVANIVFCVWCVALPIMAGISLVRLKGRSILLKYGALFMFGLTAVFLNYWIIAEQLFWIDIVQGDNYLRVMAVMMLLTACLVLNLPLVYKLQKLDKDAAIVSTALDMEVFCPRCRTRQTVHTGHSRCSQCRLKFIIQVEEPRCPRCDYLLHNLTQPVCPECGIELGDEEVAIDPGSVPV